MSRNEKLQELCRKYLLMLRPIAEKFGLGDWIDDTIKANLNNKCNGTEEQVEMLARCVDDERIKRHDVPKLCNMSYRQFDSNEYFNNIKKLKHVGIYSKVSALLFADKIKKEQKQGL